MQLYVAIGIDQTEGEITILGFDTSEIKCKDKAKSRWQFEYEVFEINESMGNYLEVWLTEMKIPKNEISKIIREIGKQLSEIL